MPSFNKIGFNVAVCIVFIVAGVYFGFIMGSKQSEQSWWDGYVAHYKYSQQKDMKCNKCVCCATEIK